MKQVVLKFPDVQRMTEFITKNRVSPIEFNSDQCTITGVFTDKLIIIAEGLFEGRVVSMQLIE